MGKVAEAAHQEMTAATAKKHMYNSGGGGDDARAVR